MRECLLVIGLSVIIFQYVVLRMNGWMNQPFGLRAGKIFWYVPWFQALGLTDENGNKLPNTISRNTRDSLENVASILIVPICEEIFKVLAVRAVLFRGVCADARAIMTYTFLPAAIFVAFENFLAWQYQFKDGQGGTWYIRFWPGMMHLVCACITGSRLARWRFQGRYRCFAAVIWPACLVHITNNGFGTLSGYIPTGWFWPIYGIFLFCIAIIGRYHVLKIQNIPVVNLQKLIATGQIQPRSIVDMIHDYCPPFVCMPKLRGICACLCCCSRRRKAGRQAQPTHHGDVPVNKVLPKGTPPSGAILIHDESKRSGKLLKTKIGIYPTSRVETGAEPLYREYTLLDRFMSLFRHVPLRPIADRQPRPILASSGDESNDDRRKCNQRQKSEESTIALDKSSSETKIDDGCESCSDISATGAQLPREAQDEFNKKSLPQLNKSCSRATTRAGSILSRGYSRGLSREDGNIANTLHDINFGNVNGSFTHRDNQGSSSSANPEDLSDAESSPSDSAKTHRHPGRSL